MFERAVCHRYCFYYTLCQVLTAGYGRRWRVDAAAISIIEIIMLTSLLSGGRAERRGWRSAAWTGRCRSLCVIGIMGWFSGGNDAFDGVRDETGAKFTEPLVSVFVCFKIHIYVSFTAILNTSRSAGFGFYDSKNVLLFKLYLRKVCKRPNDWSVTGIQTSQTDALLLCSVFAHFENQIRLSVADSGLILVRDRTGRLCSETDSIPGSVLMLWLISVCLIYPVIWSQRSPVRRPSLSITDELLEFIQVQIKERVAVRGANVSDVTP